MKLVGRTARVCLAAALASTFLLSAGPAAAAAEDGTRVITPVHRVDGMTGGQLLAQFWRRGLALPVTASVGPCLRSGRTGAIVTVQFEKVCAVERGTVVFLHPYSAICANIEPPYFSPVEAVQQRCARESVQNVAAIRVTVDGGRTVNIHHPRYVVLAPQRSVQLPPNNVYGVAPQTITFSGFGWVAVIKHLALGRHTVGLTVVFTDGSRFSKTQVVRIVRDEDRTNNRPVPVVTAAGHQIAGDDPQAVADELPSTSGHTDHQGGRGPLVAR